MGLVLIQGAEGLLADRAISEILAAHHGAQVTTLSADDVELGVITDSLAPSLFGDTRIVVIKDIQDLTAECSDCLLYTSPSPRDYAASRMPSSA